MQLTIFHQLIGQTSYFLGKKWVIVDVCFINSEPHYMIHDRFEKAAISPFHGRKWVFSFMYPLDNFNSNNNE